MDPSIIVAGIALAGVLGTAVLQYLKGNKADKAMATSEAVRVSQHGLVTLVEQLRVEVKRYKEATAECEAECHEIRDENAELLDQIVATRAALRAQEQVTMELQGQVSTQSKLIAALKLQLEGPS